MGRAALFPWEGAGNVNKTQSALGLVQGEALSQPNVALPLSNNRGRPWARVSRSVKGKQTLS